MFWKKITLDGFIPFSHVGNKHVEINFVEPACAIIGSNGSGKSSLLRIMDVASPPIRTQFAKDGKIEMVVEHAGHTFTLTSDFSNSSAPHSFKKDGVELNLSGTSDTQRDLAFEHLGITAIINEIMAGNVKICSMQKAQRKQLFSVTYPSDLSFILEYHKKVCSQIRALGNQIKLLQSREGSLMASLLDENERKRMTEWRDTAQSIVTRIDKINIVLESEIAQLKNHDALKQDYDEDSIRYIDEYLPKYLHDYQSHLLDYSKGKRFGEKITVESLTSQYNALNAQRNGTMEKKKALMSRLNSIRDEINKLIRIKNTPSSDKKDALEQELVLIEKEMNDLKADPNFTTSPSIPKEQLDRAASLVTDINDLVTTLHPYAGKLIGQEEITRMRSENESIRLAISQYQSERASIELQLAQNNSRKDMLTQNSYPKDCTRVCGLRATLEATVRDIDLRISELSARLEKILEDTKYQMKLLEDNQKVMQEISPSFSIMKGLYDKLSENGLLFLALDDESFIDCLNAHCYEIPNRIVRGIESSKLYYRYKDLHDKAESIKNTLSMVATADEVKLSMQMIDDLLCSKQIDLESGIFDLEKIDRVLTGETNDLNDISSMKQTLYNIEFEIDNATKAFNAKLVQSRIDFDTQLITEHNNVRNIVSSKLREVEYTLSEQKRILDVLDTEIRPTLDSLRKQKADWELVESGLSPTSGLPCIYLIRFMNRIIHRANEFIANVWYCDMEIAYIEEKDTLDFTIGLILNKSTTVKDISDCSQGQKAVIDIAFMLALAVERGYVDWMPVKLDESDANLTDEHRSKLTDMIARMIENHTIKQLFMVSHFAAQTGIPGCDCVCLSTDNIVVPAEYNKNAIIE